MNRFLVTLRRAVSPIARPLWRRIKPRLVRVTDLFKLSDAWHQHAPALINAAASVSAMAREQQRMKRDYDAAIADLRAQVAQVAQSSPSSAGIRLNLGPVPQAGYTNIDTREAPGIDIVAAFDSLPFGPGDVSEIQVHAPDATLLPYWMGLLKAGGTFRAVK